MKVTLPFVRSPYNYDRDAASDESGLSCPEPSKAVQESKDESDINVIVARFGLTDKLPQGAHMPQYGDFEGIADYQSALNAVMAAEDSFAAMPAPIRSRFHNNPAAFVDFCSDPNNREEAEKMGLVDPKRPPEPVKVLMVGQEVPVPKEAPKGP